MFFQNFSLSLFGLAACINSSVWLILEGFMEGRALTKEEMDIQTCTAHHNATNVEAHTCFEAKFVGNSTTSSIEEDLPEI